MSCNNCPLLESCRSSMELERQIGLFVVESDYNELQQKRSQEWKNLADEQPLYVDSDDSLVETDKRLLQAESSLIASNEVMDKVEYSLEKSAYSEWLDNDRLKLDEVACPGPTTVRKWMVLGEKILICNSQARIKRVQAFQSKVEGI